MLDMPRPLSQPVQMQYQSILLLMRRQQESHLVLFVLIENAFDRFLYKDYSRHSAIIPRHYASGERCGVRNYISYMLCSSAVFRLFCCNTTIPDKPYLKKNESHQENNHLFQDSKMHRWNTPMETIFYSSRNPYTVQETTMAY